MKTYQFFDLVKKHLFLIVVILVYIITFIAVSTNFRDAYLWFDEAGQFWISKGLNHDTNPLHEQKGLLEVIENNAFYNMDPGGFSILLHFWTKISNSYLWLRFLPSLFFIGTIASIIYLSYRWTRNINIALLFGFLPFLIPLIVYMGFEIRAYSMEYLGAVLVIVALESIKSKTSYKRLFIWSCILSILMTSRYSIIIIIFIASIYVVYLIWNSYAGFWGKVFPIFLYALPLFVSLVYIYIFSLRIQNLKAVQIFYLPYLLNDWRLLFTPIYNFLYILIVVFLLFVLVISLSRKSIFSKYQVLLSITVISNLSFIALSFLGKYPWEPLSRSGLPYFIITLLCFSAIFGEILVYIIKNPSVYKYVTLLIIVILTLYIRKDTFMQRSNIDEPLLCYENIDFNDFNIIYVDRWENPVIRYLFEYGVLKPLQFGNYPEKFTFGKLGIHTVRYKSYEELLSSQPNMNDLLEYDLLITPELVKKGENDKWTLFDGCEEGVFIKK